jgi:hypothetical protein
MTLNIQENSEIASPKSEKYQESFNGAGAAAQRRGAAAQRRGAAAQGRRRNASRAMYLPKYRTQLNQSKEKAPPKRGKRGEFYHSGYSCASCHA